MLPAKCNLAVYAPPQYAGFALAQSPGGARGFVGRGRAADRGRALHAGERAIFASEPPGARHSAYPAGMPNFETPNGVVAANDSAPPQAFFHIMSGTVRFWVQVGDEFIGATIGRETLHYRYHPDRSDDDPLATYVANAAEIDAAVKRRVATGSREPVMLRDPDVRAPPRP